MTDGNVGPATGERLVQMEGPASATASAAGPTPPRGPRVQHRPAPTPLPACGRGSAPTECPLPRIGASTVGASLLMLEPLGGGSNTRTEPGGVASTSPRPIGADLSDPYRAKIPPVVC